MAWWLWVLIWLALVLAACVVLFLLLRQVWRKVRLLFRDLGTASERLSAVTAELERLQDLQAAEPEPAAVFQSPSGLRAKSVRAKTKQRGPRRRSQT